MKPETYFENFLKVKSIGELRSISESLVKKLEDRKISKNNTDFVCDDLPDPIEALDNRNKNFNKATFYTKVQRQGYAFWTRVLKLVKEKENG